MPSEWVSPIELRREGGEIHAYTAELPEAIASGDTAAEALSEMSSALIAAVRGRIKDGMDLEIPGPLEPGGACHPVPLPARLAAKAAAYAAWKRSGLSEIALAERIGRGESEARRILDPDHGTKLDHLEDAAAALGGRLRVTFEEA